MRAVEGLLTSKPQTMRDLAATVFAVERGDLTRAQIEAVRRACKRLAEDGKAELAARRENVAERGRGSVQRFLTVRTPRTQEERDQWMREVRAVGIKLAVAMGKSAAS